MISIAGVGHYLHTVNDGEALPSLTERLAPLCREKFRRIDRFIQLALLGSAECVRGKALRPDCALYICSGIGPVGNNIVVQDAIVRNHVLPTPFHFVNTLGSSAGYYVARNLELAGQSLFISRRGASYVAGFDVASTDLASGAVSQALLGVVEECTLPLSEHRERQGLRADAKVAEGSHWLLLEMREDRGTPMTVGIPEIDADAGRHDSEVAAVLTGALIDAPSGSYGFAQVAEGDSAPWTLVSSAT